MKAILATICLVLSLFVQVNAQTAQELSSTNSPVSSSIQVDQTDRNHAWPHETSDLKPNPAAIWGKLDNGLRYVILPTKSLPTRASLNLYLDVGSLMEADDQQGMAHFLEHLAFCGTRHFPAGQTIEYFQRLGMKFGAHTNARTEFDKTVYQLELPRANEELIGDGLRLFRDFLDGMLLDKKEIERERGVILSEILDRGSTDFRALVAKLEFTQPHALLAARLPVGRPATVRALSRERFVDFYETWYTPGRAVVVATGDFDVKM